MWDKELTITDELRAKVEHYHLIEQGDKKCRVSRVIRAEDGWPCLFVRVVNAQGERWRCIEDIDTFTDSVVEVMSCSAEDEADMIYLFTSGREPKRYKKNRKAEKGTETDGVQEV